MAAKKRRRHTPDHTICKLPAGNKLMASGQELDAVCRHPDVGETASKLDLGRRSHHGGPHLDARARTLGVVLHNEHKRRPLHRQRFFDPLIADLAVSLAGRDAYLELEDSHDVSGD